MQKPRIIRLFSVTGWLAFASLSSVTALPQTTGTAGPSVARHENAKANVGKASALAVEVAGPVPRTPDGKPDLSGTWSGGGGYINKDLPGKELPYTNAGKVAYQYNMTKAPDPQSLCILVGEPRATLDGYPFEILQSPKRLAFLYERDSSWRLVPLDKSTHEKDPDPTFFGDSVSHWEGDTLVVDVVGIKGEKIWTDNEGHPQSDALHLVERWTRLDEKNLQVVLTIDDPKFYTKPFTVTRRLKLQKYEPAEFACDEFNIDREHLGPGLGTKDGTRGYDKDKVPGGVD